MLLDLLGLIGARAWIPKVSDQPRNPHEFRPSFPLPSFIPLVLLYGALTQRAIALVLRYATIHYTVMYIGDPLRSSTGALKYFVFRK